MTCLRAHGHAALQAQSQLRVSASVSASTLVQRGHLGSPLTPDLARSRPGSKSCMKIEHSCLPLLLISSPFSLATLHRGALVTSLETNFQAKLHCRGNHRHPRHHDISDPCSETPIQQLPTFILCSLELAAPKGRGKRSSLLCPSSQTQDEKRAPANFLDCQRSKMKVLHWIRLAPSA